VNIAAQHLQSNQQIGYVEIDVDAQHSDVALGILSALEGTLRCRIPY
jgi:D-3-phosphoglycerate dehydrogenase